MVIKISGNFVVAKDALAEITSRLRVRTLRDANAGEEHAPTGPPRRFGPPGSLPVGGLPPLPSAIIAGSSGRYDPLKVTPPPPLQTLKTSQKGISFIAMSLIVFTHSCCYQFSV